MQQNVTSIRQVDVDFRKNSSEETTGGLRLAYFEIVRSKKNHCVGIVMYGTVVLGASMFRNAGDMLS